MVSEVYSTKDLARIGSYIGMMISMIPAFAPIVGGYIEESLGWRANFVMIFLLIAFTFIWSVLVIPETNRNLQPNVMRMRRLVTNYKALLTNTSFIVFPICACLAFSIIMVYLAISPFLFQDVIGFSPVQYGWLAVIVGCGIAVGSVCNAWLVRLLELHQLLLIAGIILVFASTLMLVLGLLGFLNVLVIMVPIFFVACGVQLVFANAFSAGMSHIDELKGMAAAIYASIQMGGAAVASSLASMVHVNNQIPLALILLLISSVLLLLTYRISRKESERDQVLESSSAKADDL